MSEPAASSALATAWDACSHRYHRCTRFDSTPGGSMESRRARSMAMASVLAALAVAGECAKAHASQSEAIRTSPARMVG